MDLKGLRDFMFGGGALKKAAMAGTTSAQPSQAANPSSGSAIDIGAMAEAQAQRDLAQHHTDQAEHHQAMAKDFEYQGPTKTW